MTAPGVPLKRNLDNLASSKYDVAIIGGGIFGCCALWDAARRGLSAVLIEKGDFCQATSANHYKMVHGGIRYLQHADFYRVLESSRERSALLRIAPHLVSPLPIVVPTYGHGTKGKELLATALSVYNLLTCNRNRGIRDRERHIPAGSVLSRGEVLGLFPGIDRSNLTGGVLFYDAQMYNPPRIGLSFVRSAVAEGADAANYLEVSGFLENDGRILGVQARDVLTGSRLEVRSDIVLNCAGPWAGKLLERAAGIQLSPSPVFSRDLGFVVSRKLNDKYSLACQIKSHDVDAVIDRGGRHIFISPWRSHTLVGVWHKIYKESPDTVTAEEAELQEYVDDVNSAYPVFNLSLDDITVVNTGLTLFGEENRQGERRLSFGKRSLLIDHEAAHKKKGLVTLIGVRATVARGMAEKALDLIVGKLRRGRGRSDTRVTPIYGGEMDGFGRCVDTAMLSPECGLERDVMESLVHNYGSKYKDVLGGASSGGPLCERIGNSKTIKGQIVYAVREEMALKLADVILRRTDLGTGANPGANAIRDCADLMGDELGWDDQRRKSEIVEVDAGYCEHGRVKDYSGPFRGNETSPRGSRG